VSNTIPNNFWSMPLDQADSIFQIEFWCDDYGWKLWAIDTCRLEIDVGAENYYILIYLIDSCDDLGNLISIFFLELFVSFIDCLSDLFSQLKVL
jgi:hypothetical protein